MKRPVIITAKAKADLSAAYRRAAENALQTARRWLNRFEKALDGLGESAERYELAPESITSGLAVRQFLFGKKRNVYRTLFIIQDDNVVVLHIRWAGRDWATPDELFD